MMCIIIFVLGVLSGGFLISASKPSLNAVVVELKNISKEHIEQITLVHEEGSIEICNIPTGEIRDFAFFPHGESSYSVKVLFKNGTLLNGPKSYVEPGYVMETTITDAKVTNEYGNLARALPFSEMKSK